MLENRSKKHSKPKKCKIPPDYNHIDDAINDAFLLSDLRKPLKTNTKADNDGQTLKKSKLRNISPILFVSVQRLKGKKKKTIRKNNDQSLS
jgi:hypothetical protein